MNEIEKQILENQKEILSYILTQYPAGSPFAEDVRILIRKTEELLSPKEEPTVPEKTDKSMNRVIKAGEGCPRCGVIEICAERLGHHNSGRCIPKTKDVKRGK